MPGKPLSRRLLNLNQTDSALFIREIGVLKKDGKLQSQNFKFPSIDDWLLTPHLPIFLKDGLQSFAEDRKIDRGLLKASASKPEVVWEIFHHLRPNKNWQKSIESFRQFKKATPAEIRNVAGILKKVRSLPPRLETLEFWFAMTGLAKSKELSDREVIFRRDTHPVKISGRYRRLIRGINELTKDIDRIFIDAKENNLVPFGAQPSLKQIFIMNLNALLNFRLARPKIHSSLISNLLSHFDGYADTPGNISRLLSSRR